LKYVESEYRNALTEWGRMRVVNLRDKVTQVRSMHTTGRIVFIPRILLAPSAYYLEIEQMDVVTAFLANLLDEKINTEQPEGFTPGSDRGSVARSPGAPRTPFFDSNSTTNVPTTVKSPAGDRSSTVKYFRVWTIVGRGTVFAH